jgi:hypothetical protein
MDINENVNADAGANVDERVMTISALIFFSRKVELIKRTEYMIVTSS